MKIIIIWTIYWIYFLFNRSVCDDMHYVILGELFNVKNSFICCHPIAYKLCFSTHTQSAPNSSTLFSWNFCLFLTICCAQHGLFFLSTLNKRARKKWKKNMPIDLNNLIIQTITYSLFCKAKIPSQLPFDTWLSIKWVAHFKTSDYLINYTVHSTFSHRIKEFECYERMQTKDHQNDLGYLFFFGSFIILFLMLNLLDLLTIQQNDSFDWITAIISMHTNDTLPDWCFFSSLTKR